MASLTCMVVHAVDCDASVFQEPEFTQCHVYVIPWAKAGRKTTLDPRDEEIDSTS